jgi:sulfur-carrier protein
VEIEVLYFASLAERSGRRSEIVSIDAAATVASLWRALEERHASLAALPFRPLAACDRAWVAWDAPLAGVREVAFVPPVSGG